MGTPPPASSTPSPNPPNGSSSPPPSTGGAGTLGRSKGLLGGILAVVIVAVIVLALLFSGVIPGLTSSSGKGGSGGGGPSYNVTFSESGLPSGTSWSVTLGGTQLASTGTSIVFQDPNGTYGWTAVATGYKATPATGTVTVSGGPQSQAISFTALPPGSYSVTFTESGLPSGTSWSVTFNGTLGSATTSTIAFIIGNGTWPYSVGAVPNYTPSSASGNVAVSGGPASQAIAFSPSGGGGGGAQTFSQAKPVADSTVAPYSSSAKLWGAFGIDSRNPYTNSTTNTTKSNCTLTGGATGTITLPTFTGNYHSGVAPAWVFLYYQASPQAAFAAVVLNGQGTYAGEESGSSCFTSGFGNFTVPSSVIDSPAAGSAAASTTNGSAFVAAHSSADAAYSLIGSYTYSYGSYNFTEPSMWAVSFTTCSAGVTGPGSSYSADINATSGAVVQSTPILTVNCTGNPTFAPAGGGTMVPTGTLGSSASREMILAIESRD